MLLFVTLLAFTISVIALLFSLQVLRRLQRRERFIHDLARVDEASRGFDQTERAAARCRLLALAQQARQSTDALIGSGETAERLRTCARLAINPAYAGGDLNSDEAERWSAEVEKVLELRPRRAAE